MNPAFSEGNGAAGEIAPAQDRSNLRLQLSLLDHAREGRIFNNAGVQMRFDFAPGNPADDDALLQEINTNLAGATRVAAAFIPHLSHQPDATLVNISSGVGYVPANTPPLAAAPCSSALSSRKP